jgi:plastocyanin
MDVAGIRVAVAVVTIAVLTGCGGSDSGDRENSAARNSSATSTTTTTPLIFSTEIGVPAPQDAVVVSMDDNTFMPSTLRVPSGTFKVALSNLETVPPCHGTGCGPSWSNHFRHDLAIIDPVRGVPIAQSERVAPGASAVFAIDGLAPGSYRFICTLHAQLSMNGQLEVAA